MGHPSRDHVRSSRSSASRPDHRGRILRKLLLILALGVAATACGGDEAPELTDAEVLAAIEGRPLTESEVAERLEVGATICQLDEPVLDAMWRRLDDDQLAFQDFVFERICPDRSIFYAGQTGRYVTEEAEDSGVVTSTTRPVSTTTTALARPRTTTTLWDPMEGGVRPSTAADAADEPQTTTSATTDG
ncbi:MAG: hypothetical protein AAF547_16565 [Actinomycetota bacterium]